MKQWSKFPKKITVQSLLFWWEMFWQFGLIKNFKKIGPVVNKTMSQNSDITHITASCDQDFVRLLQAYKELKRIKQNSLLALCLCIMLPFSYAVGFLCVFLLVSLLAGIMAYLVISQQNTIDEIQRSLYSICLKSVSEQVQRVNDNHQDWSFLVANLADHHHQIVQGQSLPPFGWTLPSLDETIVPLHSLQYLIAEHFKI